MYKILLFVGYTLLLTACSITGLLPSKVMDVYVTSKTQLDNARGINLVKYKAQFGVSVYRLSQEFGVPMEELAQINLVEEGHVFSRGEEVVLAQPVWDKIVRNGLNQIIPDGEAGNASVVSGVRRESVATKKESASEPVIVMPVKEDKPVVAPEPATVSIADKAIEQADAKAVGERLLFGWPAPGRKKYSKNGSEQWESPKIEIAMGKKKEIVAAEDGNVVFTGEGSGALGRVIVIAHGKGYMSTYSSYDTLSVSLGQRVLKGEVIARVAEKLEFGIRHNGKAVNPLNYVKPI